MYETTISSPSALVESRWKAPYLSSSFASSLSFKRTCQILEARCRCLWQGHRQAADLTFSDEVSMDSMEYLICDFSWFLMSHSLSIFIWFSDSNDFKASHIFSPTATHFRIFTTSWHILLVTPMAQRAPCNLIRCDSSILPWLSSHWNHGVHSMGRHAFLAWRVSHASHCPLNSVHILYHILYNYNIYDTYFVMHLSK